LTASTAGSVAGDVTTLAVDADKPTAEGVSVETDFADAVNALDEVILTSTDVEVLVVVAPAVCGSSADAADKAVAAEDPADAVWVVADWADAFVVADVVGVADLDC